MVLLYLQRDYHEILFKNILELSYCIFHCMVATVIELISTSFSSHHMVDKA